MYESSCGDNNELRRSLLHRKSAAAPIEHRKSASEIIAAAKNRLSTSAFPNVFGSAFETDPRKSIARAFEKLGGNCKHLYLIPAFSKGF